LCCLFFSFFPSSYHRYLHSFPTRRSSDLAYHVPVTDLELGGLAVVLFVLRHSTNRTKPVENVVPAYGGVPIDDAMRSNLCSRPEDRKSTRLNSSHVKISYAVFCLKKKTLI